MDTFTRSLSVVSTTVIRLLFSRRPAAILRAVMPVIIDAVNGVLRAWSWPHITVERLETIAPPCADLNAAPTVTLVFRRLLSIAAALHQGPDVVLGRCRHTMSARISPTLLGIETAAALGISPSQAYAENAPESAAITTTKPRDAISVFRLQRPNNRPAIKSLPRDQSYWSHIFNFTITAIRIA